MRFFHEVEIDTAFQWHGREWRKIDQTHATPVDSTEPNDVEHVPSHENVDLDDGEND